MCKLGSETPIVDFVCAEVVVGREREGDALEVFFSVREKMRPGRVEVGASGLGGNGRLEGNEWAVERGRAAQTRETAQLSGC
jgi:hypothetical protein